MAECQVCFCTAEEVAEVGAVQTRHMLPCQCKLLLCDTCVLQIRKCLYHRATSFGPLSATDTQVQQLVLENALLRNYVGLIAFMSSFMVVFNALAFVLGGAQCGTFISFFLGITAFIMMQLAELGTSPWLQLVAFGWWALVSVFVFVWSWCMPP